MYLCGHLHDLAFFRNTLYPLIFINRHICIKPKLVHNNNPYIFIIYWRIFWILLQNCLGFLFLSSCSWFFINLAAVVVGFYQFGGRKRLFQVCPTNKDIVYRMHTMYSTHGGDNVELGFGHFHKLKSNLSVYLVWAESKQYAFMLILYNSKFFLCIALEVKVVYVVCK